MKRLATRPDAFCELRKLFSQARPAMIGAATGMIKINAPEKNTRSCDRMVRGMSYQRTDERLRVMYQKDWNKFLTAS